MTVRVTATEVKEIIVTTVEDSVVDVMIASANLLVTDQLAGELSAGLLKEIERWLSAHLLSMSLQRQTIKEEIGGDTNEQYATLGLNLDGSSYGQTVKMLDTTGLLANLGKSKGVITAVTSFED